MPTYPKSDHCDGSKFYNLKDPIGNSLWAGAKMIASARFEKWPDYVRNSPSPNLNSALNHDEVAITFVNHATVLVQTASFNFLTDPVWSDRVSPLTWAGPKRHRDPGITFAELPRIDLVLISHNHYDHLDLNTLKRLNERFHPRFIVPLGNQTFLDSQGISNLTELDWWQSTETGPDSKVSLAPAEHFSGRSPFDKNKTLWGSFVISFGGHSIYFGGDTAYAPHFSAIRERYGTPDIAFLPIGAYDPRWFMKAIHTNPDEAVQAHLDLGAKQSIGIHFGTFQMTGEKIDQPVTDLAIALQTRKLDENQFIVLGEGQTRIFQLST